MHKAISGNKKFTYHYYFNPNNYTSGTAIEESILAVFKDVIKKEYQIICPKYPFLSATIDAFTHKDSLPVEIKTSNQTSIKRVVQDHYNQLQYSMLCSNSLLILVFIYLFNSSFQIIKLHRDDAFIENTLPRLEYAYYKHLLNEDKWIAEDDLEQMILRIERL